MSVKVYDLEFDEDNESEMAEHDVTAREAMQVLDGSPKLFRNRRGHEAEIIMIGRTLGGRLLTIPLASRSVAGLWRPASAFESNDYDAARYRDAGGK